MRYTLPQLLERLGAPPTLVSDDVDPVAFYDPETECTYMGEVRVGTEDDESLSCEIAVVHFD